MILLLISALLLRFSYCQSYIRSWDNLCADLKIFLRRIVGIELGLIGIICHIRGFYYTPGLVQLHLPCRQFLGILRFKRTMTVVYAEDAAAYMRRMHGMRNNLPA